MKLKAKIVSIEDAFDKDIEESFGLEFDVVELYLSRRPRNWMIKLKGWNGDPNKNYGVYLWRVEPRWTEE